MTCEADEAKEEDADAMPLDGPPKRTHGGCGHHQPLVRKEALKLFFHYKKQNDDEVGSSVVVNLD